MKSERRHEIQENSLAHFLEGAFESARPHAALIGGIILAVVLAYIAYVVMALNSSGPIQDQEWQAVYTTLDQSFRTDENDVAQKKVADEFAAIAKEYGKSRPALWSEYFYGQQILSQASDVAFSDPKSATADLDRAVQTFQKVYDETDLPVLKVKALWSMAEAYELQATSDSIGKAQANFEEITKIWPDTNTARLAQDRLDRLKNPSISGKDGFYAWYRTQDFAAHTAEAAAKNRTPLDGGIPGMDMNLEAPAGGLFDNPGPGAGLPGVGTPGTTPLPGTESDPLFTPSMNLDPADGESTPQPSSFTEKEEAATSDKSAAEPMKTEEQAEPMKEAPAEPAKEEPEAPKAETPAKEEPAKEEPAKEEAAPETPAAETPAEPTSEEPKTEEKPAEGEEAPADPK